VAVQELQISANPGGPHSRRITRGDVMAVLMRTDPFRELDRLTQQLFTGNGSAARPVAMPMDAYRDGETFVVHFDLPGVDPGSIDLDVERNVLTVRAERKPAQPESVEMVAAERPRGTFTRQLFLGETLDAERIAAHYDAGVLTLHIPVREQAKPRKITVTGGGASRQIQGSAEPSDGAAAEGAGG
jgi:HSP20 family protein